MMHTKLALIATILIVSSTVYGVDMDCSKHPLKPKNMTDGEWTDKSVMADAGMKFCKGLAGKDVCLTPKGVTAMKAKFDAKKKLF